MGKVTIPTGWEADQRKAAARRKLAERLLAQALGPQGGMTSWTQPLAQMANAFAGNMLDRRADKMDADVASKMRETYASSIGNLQKDVAAGMDLPQVVQKYGADPLMQDMVKPYVDALGKRISEKENVVKVGGAQGYGRVGDFMGKPLPNDPNDPVVIGSDGSWKVNDVRRQAALEAQGYSPNGQGFPTVRSMPDPAMAPPAGGAPATGGDGLDLSLLNPEERGILQNELTRRAGGQGAPISATMNPDPNTPMGSPLGARRRPAGQVNGKPYWIIDGVPYDNPEGK